MMKRRRFFTRRSGFGMTAYIKVSFKMISRAFLVCTVWMFWFFVSRTSGETKVVSAWGIDDPRAPDSLEPVVEFKNFTGLDPMIVAWRENFSQRFPTEKCASVQAAGRLPLIMWDVDPGSGQVISLQNILRGEYDDYCRSWADAASQNGKPVLIHFLRQFNQSVHPWSIAANQKRASEVSKAFRKVASVFRERDANNVRWVWGPYVFPSPAAAWNQWEDAYPGDSYVDFLALDGLDFGNESSTSLPLSFEQLFSSPVRRLRILARNKPILLTEVGTASVGVSRERWIREMANTLVGAFSNVRGLIWYNHAGGANWRMRKGDQQSFQKASFHRLSFLSMESLLERPFWPLQILPGKGIDPPVAPSWRVAFTSETNLAKVPSALKDHPVLNLDSRFVTLVGHNLEKDRHLAARIRFGWNPTALIIWCEVDDSTVGEGRLEPEKIWDGDAVELDFGPPLNERSARMKGCNRLLVSPGGPRQLKPSLALIHGSDGSLVVPPDEIVFQSQFGIDNQGYRIYGVIPWKSVGLTPGTKDSLLFNISIADGVQGHCKRRLVWSGGAHYYHDSSEWGRLELLPSGE